MKNEVRPIDANATVEALRANFQQGSWYGCEEPCYQIAEDTIAEMPTLTAHFPDLTKMIPLTLEQLRGMVGHPVIVKYSYGGPDTVSIVNVHFVPHLGTDKIRLVFADGYITVNEKDYGTYFTVYAYPPAHIDREAWKCPLCERNKVISFEAWEDESKLPKGQSVRGGALFCPHCGKPRTPEAWAELEKRMGLA